MTTACPICGEPIPPAAGSRVRLYCSPRCKEQAKGFRRMERYRADPEYRQSVRARQITRDRALGVRERKPRTGCDVPGCDRKHCARGLCAKHWKAVNRHRWEGTPTTVLHAAVIHDGVTVQRPITVRIAYGVLVDCPTCGFSAMGGPTPAHRICPLCTTGVQLNAEEVAWLSAPLGGRFYERTPA